MDHLKILALRRDPDALVAYAIAACALLFALVAPSWLWDRTLDRLGIAVGAIGLPMLVTIGRYFVRGKAASAVGTLVATREVHGMDDREAGCAGPLTSLAALVVMLGIFAVVAIAMIEVV